MIRLSEMNGEYSWPSTAGKSGWKIWRPDAGKKLGISLPFTGLAWLRHYYQQTRSAIEYGMLYRPGSTVFEFYDYAVLWLLESSAGTDCRQLCACNPDAVRMAEAHYLENEENQLDTLYM